MAKANSWLNGMLILYLKSGFCQIMVELQAQVGKKANKHNNTATFEN